MSMGIIKIIKLNTKNQVSSSLIGGKGLNLIKLVQAGFKVPEGFIVDVVYFERESASIRVELEALLGRVTEDNIQQISKQIQNLFMGVKFSDNLKSSLIEEFKNLKCSRVAVRSSAANEDGKEASWAGQLSTKLNIEQLDLEDAIKSCWASAYGVRALQYAKHAKLKLNNMSVAVVVQRMIQSDVSGVAFSTNPVTKNNNEILIEAVYGLGEAIVSGEITPDEYIVNAQDLSLVEQNQEDQFKQLSLAGSETAWVDVAKELQNKAKLKQKEVIEIARVVQGISAKLNYPADVEWALEGGELYVTQSRPITTL